MKIGQFKVCETSETEERPQTSLYKTGAIIQTNKDNLSFSKRTGIISVGCASSSLLFNQRKSWYRLRTSYSLESNSPREV